MPSRILVYINQANRGFSETYYTNASFDVFSPDDPFVVNFLRARVRLLSAPSVIYAIRSSAVDPPRRSLLFNLGNKYQAGKVQSGAPISGEPDPVSTDAVIKFGDGTGAFRNLFLRGLPDAFVSRDRFGNDEQLPIFGGALFDFYRTFAGLGLRIRVAQKAPTIGFTPISVISITADGLNPHHSVIALRAAPNFNLATRPQVRFQQIDTDNTPGFPRIAEVLDQSNVAPFSVTIPYRLRNAGPVTPPNMRMIPLGYIYNQITSFAFMRFSERKTGRPFGSLRGRARALVRAQ